MGIASKLRFQEPKEGRRVLLADADTVTRARLAAGLRADGHEVVEVVGPTQLLFALQIVADALGPAPQVVIVDVSMGDARDVLLAYRESMGTCFLVLLTPPTIPQGIDELDPLAVFARPIDEADVRTIVMNAPLLHRVRAGARRARLQGRR